MDLDKVIRDLYEEKTRLDQIITSLEQMEKTGKETSSAPREKRRGPRLMNSQARLEVSRRMKEYWASRRQGDVQIAKQITNGSPSPALNERF